MTGRVRQLSRHGGWVAFTLALGVLVLRPIIQLQRRAVADNARALRDVVNYPNIGRVLRTTVQLGLGSTLVAVVLGVALALAAERLPERGRRTLQLIPIVPLVIPAVAAVIGWMFLLSPSVGYLNTGLRLLPMFNHLRDGPVDVYSIGWITVITGFSLTSFVYLFVQTALQNMGGAYHVAAATCGASRIRSLLTVTLPLLRPAVTYSAGIVLLLSLGQFTAPLLLGRRTGVDVLTTEMFKVTETFPVDFGLIAALGTPLIGAGLAVVLLQRLAVGDQRRFVVARARGEEFPHTTSRWAVASVLLYGLFAVALPVAALGYVSVSRFWSGTVSLGNLTLSYWTDALDEGALRDAIWLSVRTAAIATAIALVIGSVAAWALSGNARVVGSLRSVIDVLCMAPVAVPASLLGFGFLFAYTSPPIVLYGKPGLLIIIYVTLVIPHVVRMQLTALTGLGISTFEASQACGASHLRTIFSVVLPQMRKSVAATVALLFVLLTHEFSASVMVRSARTNVLGAELYEAYRVGLYPQVAVVALIMVAVTAAGVAIALVFGGSAALKGFG